MEIRKIDNADTRQAKLTRQLAEASLAYYNGMPTTMTDAEFDKGMAALEAEERANGFAYEGSPTIHAGSTVVTQLEKARHEIPALSLDKVKYVDRQKMTAWLDGHDGVLSWKLDGLTIVATYDNGKLTRAVTRGDGEEGGIITHNAVSFLGLPVRIPYAGHLVVRGEALMSYEEFERINKESDGIYENPRNLAAATVQMYDGQESAKRKIDFYAFKLVTPNETQDTATHLDTETGRFAFLADNGFRVVPHELVSADSVLSKIDEWQAKLPENAFPTDGLVFSYDDWKYAESLGTTNKYPRGSIALKWDDATKETTISNVRFSVGRTGRITPVAIFSPSVRLGAGSNISRASLHNISVMRNMPETGNPGYTVPVKIGSRAEVALAQMIIPAVVSVKGGDTDVTVPDVCPVCGEPTNLDVNGGVEVLYCRNPKCAARTRGALESAFSKSGLYAKGLGPAAIEDLQQAGLVTVHPAEFFAMERKCGTELPVALAKMDGWGQKSWNVLLKAIREAKQTTLRRFLYSLNVPMLGNDLSKKLADFWDESIDAFLAFYKNPDAEAIKSLEGVGEAKANALVKWCLETQADPIADRMLYALIEELEIAGKTPAASTQLAGMTFVITGAVYQYKNRDEFKASVEARGGKVAGSVSSKTDYLVNNDAASTSSKNQAAKKLGIPIITEDMFIGQFGR